MNAHCAVSLNRRVCIFLFKGVSSFNCINIGVLMNGYGHPHQELLDRLNMVKSQVEITYETGAITIWTDGKRMEVERYLSIQFPQNKKVKYSKK